VIAVDRWFWKHLSIEVSPIFNGGVIREHKEKGLGQQLESEGLKLYPQNSNIKGYEIFDI